MNDRKCHHKSIDRNCADRILCADTEDTPYVPAQYLIVIRQWRIMEFFMRVSMGHITKLHLWSRIPVKKCNIVIPSY